MSDNTYVPAPTPPWHRDVKSPQTQTLYDDGVVSLTMDTTYLDSAVVPDDGLPYSITLPAGTYKRQIKRIYIPKAQENSEAQWRIAGTFVGFNTLLMSKLAHECVLEWDGAGWHLIGGNALREN